MHGLWGWVYWYALWTSRERERARKQAAAWRMRMEGVEGGTSVWARYEELVQEGCTPVGHELRGTECAVKQEAWQRWCKAEDERRRVGRRGTVRRGEWIGWVGEWREAS